MKHLLIAGTALLLLAACSTSPEISFNDLPPGDTANGATLFTNGANGAPACATCHTVDGSELTGPSLQHFASIAPVAEAGAASLGEYAYISITHPSNYLVSGFGNTMYTRYARQLSPQQIADLIAYLKTL